MHLAVLHPPADDLWERVEEGLADGAVIGDVFAAPSWEQVYTVAAAVDTGAGVLLTYGNYTGDVLNFDAAQARLRADRHR